MVNNPRTSLKESPGVETQTSTTARKSRSGDDRNLIVLRRSSRLMLLPLALKLLHGPMCGPIEINREPGPGPGPYFHLGLK